MKVSIIRDLCVGYFCVHLSESYCKEVQTAWSQNNPHIDMELKKQDTGACCDKTVWFRTRFPRELIYILFMYSVRWVAIQFSLSFEGFESS